MIEQMRRAAVLLVGVALFAPAAWGQGNPVDADAPDPSLTQEARGMVTVASEYFGVEAGREVAIAGTRKPRILLNVSSANGIDQGNTATLTFTLNGATFAAAVSGANLKIQRYVEVKDNPGGGTATYSDNATFDNNSTARLTAGGGAGESSVSFLVTAGSMELVGRVHPGMNLGGAAFPADRAEYLAADLTADSGSQTDEVDFFTFELPNLQVTGATLGEGMAAQTGVFVTASSVPGTTTGDSFPAIRGTGTMPANSVNPMADGMIVSLMQAITATLDGGTDAETSIEGEGARMRLSGTGGAVMLRPAGAPATADSVPSLLLSQLTVSFATTPQQLRNNEPVASASNMLDPASGLGGNVRVSVSGNFREGDKVYYGPDGQTKDFTIAGGVATYPVPIAGLTNMMIRYVPGGTEPLRPATFTTTMSLDFSDPSNKSGAVTGPMSTDMAEITYGGIERRAYAYGVVRAGGIEISYVRTGCAGGVTPPATGCTIFWDCTDQAGNSYFSEPTSVPVSQTEVFSSSEIADAFPGGGWDSGRGSCSLWSNGMLEVQNMTRSGVGQVNNSVVVGSAGGGNVGILVK